MPAGAPSWNIALLAEMAAEFQAGMLGFLKQEALSLARILALAGIVGGLAVAMALTGVDAKAFNVACGKSLARRKRCASDGNSNRSRGNAAAQNESHFHLCLPSLKKAPQRGTLGAIRR